MGKKYNELTDDVFKDSRYIKMIKQNYGIKDFRKEHREHYNMILDIFQTTILLNNCFFSDNDLRIDDRIKQANKLLKNYFKINENENVVGVKYSVRDIQSICDKYCRHIYNLMSEWYYSIFFMVKDKETDNKMLNKIKEEITNEVEMLEYSGIYDIVIDNITYQKHKIKNYRKYKKYFCKFDNIYIKSGEYKEEYKKEFYNRYGIKLDNKEMNKLALLFKLLASLNNGLVNVINDYKIDKEFTSFDNNEEYYIAYLNSFNIDYNKDKYDFNNDIHTFIKLVGIIKNKIDTLVEYNNTIIIERLDMFFFYLTIEQCFYTHKIKVKTDFMNKLLNDLIDLYKKLDEARNKEKELLLDGLKEQYFISLYQRTSELIERYGDVYEKVS